MKQVVFTILGVVFLILGLIGLVLPVIPQVPFLVLSAVFFSIASKRFKNRLISSRLYKEHLEKHVVKHKIISNFFKSEGGERNSMSDAKKLLIVIDMQNDFIDGALGTKEAEAIVEAVRKKISSYPAENVYATMDTHGEDYLDTQEGKNLPVKHCIKGTEGWNIRKEIAELLDSDRIYEKPCFGGYELAQVLRNSGKQIAVTDPAGGVPYYKAELGRNTALVIGNEGNGISDEVMALADIRVTLPMKGGTESLNAAVSAAILMYEAVRTED